MKRLLITGIAAALLVVSGCQQAQDPGKNESEKGKQQQNINAGLHNRYTSNDTMLNKRPNWRTLSDPEVLTGRVHIESGRAVGTLILDKNTEMKEAHRLAQRYAIEIKEVYKRYPANVHVVQEGRNQFTIELK